MTVNNHSYIVDNDQLRQLSGKCKPTAVRKWASAQGIRVMEGANGPWTTLDAVNAALGIAQSTHDTAYPTDIL